MLHGNEACQRCAYWDPFKQDGPSLGLCRRLPPRLEAHSEFPMTKGEDWCGEFVGAPPGNARLKEVLDEIPPLEPQVIPEGDIQPESKPPGSTWLKEA